MRRGGSKGQDVNIDQNDCKCSQSQTVNHNARNETEGMIINV